MKTLTEAFNSISVKKGDQFAIELKGNGATGYSWDISLTAGKASFITTEFFPDGRAALFGGGGTYSWVYRAEEDGLIEINAEYKRVWEKQPAAKTVKFHISVGN